MEEEEGMRYGLAFLAAAWVLHIIAIFLPSGELWGWVKLGELVLLGGAILVIPLVVRGIIRMARLSLARSVDKR